MRQIQGYEKLYSVTRDGRIWSHRSKKWLRPYKATKRRNRLYVDLQVNRKISKKSIHRLVAQAYVPNLENKSEVNHKDGDSLNNNVDNLEWVTPSENAIHAIKNGFASNPPIKYGEKNNNSKLTKKQVIEIRKNHNSKKIMKQRPWEKYGISMNNYYQVIRGNIWKNIGEKL